MTTHWMKRYGDEMEEMARSNRSKRRFGMKYKKKKANPDEARAEETAKKIRAYFEEKKTGNEYGITGTLRRKS